MRRVLKYRPGRYQFLLVIFLIFFFNFYILIFLHFYILKFLYLPYVVLYFYILNFNIFIYLLKYNIFISLYIGRQGSVLPMSVKSAYCGLGHMDRPIHTKFVIQACIRTINVRAENDVYRFTGSGNSLIKKKIEIWIVELTTYLIFRPSSSKSTSQCGPHAVSMDAIEGFFEIDKNHAEI